MEYVDRADTDIQEKHLDRWTFMVDFFCFRGFDYWGDLYFSISSRNYVSDFKKLLTHVRTLLKLLTNTSISVSPSYTNQTQTITSINSAHTINSNEVDTNNSGLPNP